MYLDPNGDNIIRVNVTLNIQSVTQCFHNIVMLMEARISNENMTAYREFEVDGAIMRLYEAMDHYMSFHLSHSRANVGIDYYIREYFSSVAPILMDPDFLRSAGVYFSQAVGYLSQGLYLAQQHIENSGGKVDEVEFTPQGLTTGNYLISGSYSLEDHLPPVNVGMPTWAARY